MEKLKAPWPFKVTLKDRVIENHGETEYTATAEVKLQKGPPPNDPWPWPRSPQ